MGSYRRSRPVQTESDFTIPREGPGYRISQARYAKGQVIVRLDRDETGMKNRQGRLAEALRGRWTGREGGYIMSAAKARKFERYVAEGKDASLKFDSLYSTHYEID